MAARISLHDHIFTKPLWELSRFPTYPIPHLPFSPSCAFYAFFLFTIFVVIFVSYFGSLCSPMSSFPPRACVLNSFLFKPTVTRGSHAQLHSFPLSPSPNSPCLHTTPFLFSPPCHIHHTIRSYFYLHTPCPPSFPPPPPVSPTLTNPTYNTYSTRIR